MLEQAKHYSKPFDHWIIPNFFDDATAREIESDFYAYDDERWLTRNHTEFEQKRLSTHWDWYPGSIYRAFYYLCSAEFIAKLKDLTGIEEDLYADFGLHAGGMHIHPNNGRLNLHRDAEMHPKLNLKRKLNIIVYLNSNWEQEWGGALELWESDSDGNPSNKVTEVPPMFNTAFLFDTTQNSWHGLPDSDAIHAPDGQDRRSIALFYYTKPTEDLENPTYRALFAPTEDQKKDPEALKKIEERMKTAYKYGR